ncbi:MAG: TVP38/TMEM64 family protein [Gammaproteobacteria bacterium]|nr:TVP38/TMEM64 family protein [Gammaproteobacteria bacterium]
MKRRIIGTVAIVAALAIAILLIPDRWDSLISVAKWAESAPEYAWPLYLLSFIASVILMFPGWIFMVAGGYLFGMTIGSLLAFIANMAGSVIAFFLSKSYARHWVEAKLAHSPRFQGFDEGVNRNGFNTILFARLALLPNNLLNYACGVTGMSLRDFTFGTALGSLPILLTNVLIGASTVDLFSTMSEEGLAPQRPPLMLLFGIIVGLALITILSRRLRGRMKNRRNTNVPTPDDVKPEK